MGKANARGPLSKALKATQVFATCVHESVGSPKHRMLVAVVHIRPAASPTSSDVVGFDWANDHRSKA